jgi:hypothetical protein
MHSYGNSLCPDMGTAAGGQVARHIALALDRSLHFAPDEPKPLPCEGIVSDDPSGALRQQHQVGRILSIFEQRLAWRSYLSTHGQPTR